LSAPPICSVAIQTSRKIHGQPLTVARILDGAAINITTGTRQ